MEMRKMGTVFVLAVLVPTLVLAWLAMRSIRDQEIVANSQRAILHQGSTEALAADLNTFMDDVRVFYRQLLDDLITEQGSDRLSLNFDQIAPERWSQCSVASVITDQGEVLCPTPATANPEQKAFLKDNMMIWQNLSKAPVYEAAPVSNQGPMVRGNLIANSRQDAGNTVDSSESQIQLKVEVAEEKLLPFRRKVFNPPAAQMEQIQKPLEEPVLRRLQPAQSAEGTLEEHLSRLEWGIGNLSDIIEGKEEGAVSRFLHDGLRVLLWKRHRESEGRDLIFWAQLDLEEIKKDLRKIVSEYAATSDVCLALVDASGSIVAKTRSDFTTDWSKPFVASEVGQILPHWEVAAYLLDPAATGSSARSAKILVWLLVPTLLAAIAVGTFLIFRSVGLEMRLARQKTDFVSNVSHELKTPLTSIRMFSDLLTESINSEKEHEYSVIISREAARLSRLINNLLDFSLLERSEKSYPKVPIDLASLTQQTLETYQVQLETEGCRLVYTPDPGVTAPVSGDRDALSQVLLNLLSNAEKYGAAGGEIEVRLEMDQDHRLVRWHVLDRGPGIERKHAAKIFEKFYRVDDSLTSSLPGCGLGLALARQIVRHHEGDITFQNRPEGGCCFTVTLPLNLEA